MKNVSVTFDGEVRCDGFVAAAFEQRREPVTARELALVCIESRLWHPADEHMSDVAHIGLHTDTVRAAIRDAMRRPLPPRQGEAGAAIRALGDVVRAGLEDDVSVRQLADAIADAVAAHPPVTLATRAALITGLFPQEARREAHLRKRLAELAPATIAALLARA
jgi:hypothetical protein